MTREVRRYNVTFNNPEYNATYSFIRTEHPGFKYGNGSLVVIMENTKLHSSVDTRYDPSVKDFDKWCVAHLSTMFDPAYEPIITEVE